MYADSKTKEPLVLELYRARGAAASWLCSFNNHVSMANNVKQMHRLLIVIK